MQYMLKRWCSINATALSVAGKLLLTIVITLVLINSVAAANEVMLDIRDQPLKDVVALLTIQSGINIIIADDSKLEKRVTISLKNVPLEKALDYVVTSAGVSYKQMEDGTYIIGGVLPEQPALTPDEIAQALTPVVPVTPPVKKVDVVKLVHSKPSELLRLIGWNGNNPMPNCDTNYPDRMNVTQPKVTNPGGGTYLATPYGQMMDTSRDMRNDLNVQPVVPTMDPASLAPSAGRTADPYTGAGQYPGAGTPGYIPGGRPATQPAPNPATQPARSNTSDDFLMPEGIEDVKPFDLDNSIIVKGDEEAIEQFKKIIRMLDVPPKQVQIKAEFIEVKTTDIKNFGIDWSLNRLNETFSTNFGPEGNVVFGFASGNLTAQLKAELRKDIGRIINSPIISTINNQNAYISINTVIPYWISMQTIVDGTVLTQETPQFITVDTHLDVLPRVNGDGTITMILRPGVADTGNIIRGANGNAIPEQRQQELFTQRRVANGETIVVGGFIRKNESNSIQKIPILGDLPIVGSLFRTTAKQDEDRELLIFVTPTIIPDTSGGTVGSSLIL